MSQWSWGTVSSAQESHRTPSITASTSFRVPLRDATRVEAALVKKLARAPARPPDSFTPDDTTISLQTDFLAASSETPLPVRVELCQSLSELFFALALVHTGRPRSAEQLFKQYKGVASTMCARGASAPPQLHLELLQMHLSKGARRVIHSLVQMFRAMYEASIQFCKCADSVVHDFGNGAFAVNVLAQCARPLQRKVTRECAHANKQVYSYSTPNNARTAVIDAQAIYQVQTVYACAVVQTWVRLLERALATGSEATK